ncbi:hypothetical protein [Cytobacillus pseudoceanisediminis]|uniref:hypothetical protein n=1 Tax=Cytobacillus pseudoceanisediminis TaxID=3051614 RepID=UPI003C2E92D4
MSKKISNVFLKKREFKKSNKAYQELLEFNKVIKEDSYQILGVRNDNILFAIEVEDTKSTANYSYMGSEFLSKILFAQNTKNTLTLESTPMVF